MLSIGASAQTNVFNTTGNVGIGTTSPAALLDIRGTGSGSLTAFQSTVSNSGSSGFWQTNGFNLTQTGPTSGGLICIGGGSTTTHNSGVVHLALSMSFGHTHSGTGSIDEVHCFDSRMNVTPTAGNITNAMVYWANLGIINGSTSTSVITNGYGLYINGFGSNVVNKYGVYVNDVTANNYFGGSLSIGTTNPGSNKLAVEGTIGARKVVVTTTNPFPDYVFHSDYALPSLDSVASYIRKNKHLPDLPTADEVRDKGVDLGNNQVLLLKKIEELTLYMIQQKEQLEAQQKEIEALKKRQHRSSK
jgi:hypothetical protein